MQSDMRADPHPPTHIILHHYSAGAAVWPRSLVWGVSKGQGIVRSGNESGIVKVLIVHVLRRFTSTGGLKVAGCVLYAKLLPSPCSFTRSSTWTSSLY